MAFSVAFLSDPWGVATLFKIDFGRNNE